MDLFSGYSDSSNNPFSGLQNAYGSQAQSNDFLSGLNSQITGRQYDPFAQSGGFGAQTSYYSGLGRDYTTATGGNIYGVDPGTWGTMSPGDQQTFNRTMGGSGASFDDRFSAAPPIYPGLQPQGGDFQFPAAISAGVDPSSAPPATSSGFNSRFGAFPDPGTPMNTPADFPGWTPPSPQSSNPYNVDPGTWGSMSAGDQATFNSAMGGRNALAQTMTGAPANGPYPNLGYNPGFGGNFAAGGGMQQYNPQQMTNDLQRTLGDIGGGGQSYQQLGMSPSDWNTFSGIVGQDAANAWLQKGSQ
jgi:hypothetical protein